MIPSYIVPEGFRYFVAGGFAICPGLATDIDVWFMLPEDEKFNEQMNMLRTHLKRWETMGAFNMEDMTERAFVYTELAGSFSLAKLVFASAKSIHIMVTSQTVEETIEQFDLSICQIAITDQGEIVKGQNYSAPGETIKLIGQYRTHPKTKERLQKYIERFGDHQRPIGTTPYVPTYHVDRAAESIAQRAKRFFGG